MGFGLGGALGIVGAVVGAFGARKSANAAKDNAEFQAMVAENNAQFDLWQAQDALDRGAFNEYVQNLKTRQLVGTQRATMGARGIDLTVGTAVDIQTDTQLMGNLDAQIIHQNAQREAFALRREAQGLSASAKNYQKASDAISPGMAFVGSLLGSATSLGSSFSASSAASGGSAPASSGGGSTGWGR